MKLTTESENTDVKTKSSLDELSKPSRSFIIALIVIVPFMVYFGVVLLYLKDAVLLEKMTALLGGFVAAILGYFFGQRPVQNLTQRLAEVSSEKEVAKRRVEEARLGADMTETDVNEMKVELESIKRLIGL